ncbi:MAG TPA: hypothetical protein VIF14_13675 [Alphaproteobacteria bacterium]|jgi:hypothetical protein
MLPADVAAFSDGLKAAFPAIRFVSLDYWQHFVDQPRWEADCIESRRREKLGLPEIELRRHMRDPTGESLHYWDSLADPAETRFYVWIEPPGWRPVWGPEDDYGLRYIETIPRLRFEFRRCHFQLGWPRGSWDDVEPMPTSGRHTLVLQGYQFLVRWNPREPEAEAFGKKVYNILRKLTACEFKVFEPDSRRAYDDKTWRMQKQCLAGRHALAWSLMRRHNYLKCDNWANLLKSADYRFRTGDVFTKAESRKFFADAEKRFQEDLRLHMEAYERFRGQPRGDIEFESRGDRLVAARLYKPSAATSTTESGAASRVALELRVRRRNGRAQWS